jgi:hypothetical protein
MRKLFAVALVVGATLALALPAHAATGAVVVYNASVSPLPGNMPSVSAEATSLNEFGDEVTLAGTARTLTSVTVTLSSWACQQGTWFNKNCVTTRGAKFAVPITLNIYGASTAGENGTVRPGSLIATVTKTFNVPYRPTANLQHCNGANQGKWWDKTNSTCNNGKAANVTFNFKSLGLHLPNDVVFGIAYNTTHHGYAPIGESAACYGTEAGCAYDSLNIGVGPATTVGAQTNPGTVFQNTSDPSQLCDSTPAVGVFNMDSPTSGCWAGYVPAIKVIAH